LCEWARDTTALSASAIACRVMRKARAPIPDRAPVLPRTFAPTCVSRLLPVLTWLALTGVTLAQGTAKPPDARELNRLCERYLDLDARAADGRGEQSRILDQLDSVPALSPAEVKAWRATIAKLVAKRVHPLEKKNGPQWFWPAKKKGDAERGFFIVGGETKKPKGLLIGMHGGGAGSGDARSAQGPMESAAEKNDWLALFPEVLEKTDRGWTDSGTEEFVLDLIEAALANWKIDRDRVFLSGHSMGGYGSWTLGAHHADLMAGLAPSAGGPTPIMDGSGTVIDIDGGVVPSLRNVAIRIYQSDDDPQVPPVANRFAVKRLEEARATWGGYDFEYWEVPKRGHDLPPGGFDALLDKVAKKARAAHPSKVVWQPAISWKRQFYWLWWEKPVAGAIVVAEVDRAKNEIRVTCDKPAEGLAVLLDDSLVDMSREVAIRLEDKEVFRGKPERSLSVVLETAARNDPELAYSARIVLLR